MRPDDEDPAVEEAEVSVLPVPQMTTAIAVARAEIDSQIATAKAYPRDMVRVRKRIYQLATLDEEAAAGCFYSVPRGGKRIEGPSVRMAEIVASQYGNIALATRIVDDTHADRVTVEATARDLEANYAVRAEVTRRVLNRRGTKPGERDEDARTLAIQAAQSVARRNAIFALVPGSEIKRIMAEVRKVAIGEASTLTQRRADILGFLHKMGVDQPRALHAVGKSAVDDVTLDDVLSLKTLGRRVKDGEISVDDAFPEDKAGKVNERLGIAKDAEAPRDERAALLAELGAVPVSALRPAQKAAKADYPLTSLSVEQLRAVKAALANPLS